MQAAPAKKGKTKGGDAQSGSEFSAEESDDPSSDEELEAEEEESEDEDLEEVRCGHQPALRTRACLRSGRVPPRLHASGPVAWRL